MTAPYEPQSLFGKIARWSIRHRRLVGLIVVLGTLINLAIASRLTVDSSTLDLLPDDEPSTVALKALNELEGGVTTLSITVGGGTEDGRHAWLEQIGQRLESQPDFQFTYHQMDPKLVWRVGLLQLTPGELAEIRDRLKGAITLGPAVMNPFVAARLMDLGPLTDRLKHASYQARLSPAEGMSRLIVRPTGQPTDMAFARRVMAEVNEAMAAIPPPEPDIELLWIGGGYRHNVEDFEGIKRDVKWTSVAALLMVLVTIALGFRDWRAVLLILIPLLIANAWTMGFAVLAVGSLNTFTSFVSAVLFGMGIDFGIHHFNRYREERERGGSLEDAVVRAWDRVGKPTMATAITASSGFLALLVGRFRGFSQLGLLLGVGVLFCLLVVMFLLPLLIMWREKATPAQPLNLSRMRARLPPTYRWVPLGFMAALLVTGVAGLQIPRLGFQYDLSELRRDGMAFGDLDETQQSLARDSYSPIVVTFDTEAALRAAHEQATADMAAGRLPEISQALSIHTVIPPDQEARLAILREIGEITRHENARYLPAAVLDNLSPLTEGPIEPLTVDDLPPALVHILGGGVGTHRLLLLASGNMWDLRETAHLADVMYARYPAGAVAGEYLCMGSLYKIMKADAPRIIGLAALLVLLTTWVDLKSPRRAISAVAVLLAGMAWVGGSLAALHIKLSIVNIVGIPILLGLGIAAVIHLLHRLAEEGPGRIGKALATTGWAALLCTTTTVVSFASLSFAGSQGVRSLGLLVVVGLTAVTLAAFVLLPLGWAAVWKVRGQVPESLWPSASAHDAKR
ncbi:MAG: MMPL family transporter [Pseudomonadota bacterium]